MIGTCCLLRRSAPLLVGAVVLAMPLSRVRADIAFEYIKIADTSTTIPGAGGTFTSFSSPQISGYNVAFIGTKSGYTGIFNSSSGTLGLTVDTTTNIPNTATPFTSFSGFSLDNSDLNPSNAAIAFTGSGSGMQGIYLSNSNGISKIVNTSTAIPSGTGAFTAFGAPSLSNGNIAFVGSGASQQGVYSNASGSLQVVANNNTTIPSGTGTFTAGTFASASLNGGDVSFVAGGASGQQGVYTTTFGSLHNVANLNTPLPGGTSGNFSGFSTVTTIYGTNSFGNGTNPAALVGIYSEYNGALTTVANTSTSIPHGTGNFGSFTTPSNWGGDAVFVGNGSGGQSGLYTNEYGNINTIINNSSSLGGKVISSVSTAGSSRAIGNADGDEFTFVANFSDASSAVYVAEQNYNWSAETSGSWDSSSNWSFGLKPRTVLYTNIQPNYGAVVTGPSTATTILGLSINTNYQQGVAELVLQPNAPLVVQQNISINYTGEVNVNGGSLITNGGIYIYGGYLTLGGGMVSGGDLNIQSDYYGRPGTVVASGIVGSHVENSSLLEVLSASAHFVNGINNYQEFEIVTGQVQIDQDVNNSGTLDVRNSIVQFGTRLDNTGQLNISFGTTDIFGNVFNDSSGQVILSGNSNTTFYDGVTNNGMTFRISAGSTAVFFGTVTGTASFTGSGTKFFEGYYEPGPAKVSLAGPATFDSSNTLQIALGGPAAGTGYAQVNVAGELSLDGTLQVTLANGYVPAVGSTYNVLNWSTVDGSFATVALVLAEGNLYMVSIAMQTGSGVNLTLTRAYWDIQGGPYNRALTGTGVELVKSTAGTATLTSAASYTGLTTLSSGKLIFSGGVAHGIGAVTGVGTLQVDPGTTLTSDGVNLLNGAWTINGIQVIRSSGTAGAYAMHYYRQDSTVLSGTSVTSNLTFGAGAKLDLQNNALIVEATAANKVSLLAQIATDIAQGYITSSSVASNSAYTLAVAVDNSNINTQKFGGVPVDSNSIIVTEALKGDANLDGYVDLTDFNIWLSNLGISSSANSASTGDLNSDGYVDLTDFNQWLSNLGHYVGTNPAPTFASGGSLPGSAVSTGGTVATPEPASLALLGLGAAGVLLRRKHGPMPRRDRR